MDDWKKQLHEHLQAPALFFKWLFFACTVGLTVGTVSAAFYHAFQLATNTRLAHPWLMLLLPAAGAAIALLYRLCGLEQDPGTNCVLAAVQEDAPLLVRLAPLVFVSTILTHLVGGSSGREGAILQIGGGLSAGISRWSRLRDPKDRQIITMCGMSAAFSALFGTPLAAAAFAMEVENVGLLRYAAIVPCVLSSVLGLWTAQQLGVPGTAFSLAGIPDLSLCAIVQTLILGVLFALLAVVFCRAMHLAFHLYQKYLPDPVLRGAAGGLLVIGLTLAVWLWAPFTFDYNGAGAAVIHAAVGGDARPEAFILKILFTAVTLGAGFKGGEIVPTFFTGAVFGCTAAPLLGLSPSFGAGLGIVSLFCGVTNCPFTSLLLAVELFSGDSPGLFTGHSLLLFALPIAVSYMLSGYHSLYSQQTIVYSKFRLDLVNKKAD
ncbi:chloride channel protein [Pseudoflavonifractor sp. 524-17]|uniref:chloride channel protein n=1 Tax=Pseudoflavonifractor sp. 524-17 TaxID=2304577 RepID=UPI00137A8485|nr:chloride channel protein [Pseudoflavonifractor sp. 524-17]NCE65146.1 chloride channel protein [Pseudoflavonifractor sp. 524-17]